MNYIHTILAISLVFAGSLRTPGQIDLTAKARLLEVGEFHGDEVKARSGEKWLGLYITNGSSSLMTSTLVVKRVYDPIVDDQNPGQITGKRVIVESAATPLFLVNGVDSLRVGPVITAQIDSNTGANFITGDTQIRIKLGNQTYRLKIASKYPRFKDDPQSMPSDAQLILETGTSNQVLYDLGEKLKSRSQGELEEIGELADTGSWELFWAGDLDSDGKLDLYLKLSDHYNVIEGILFLSSKAEVGQLVKEIARFVTTGC
jgi:hypothetical protein